MDENKSREHLIQELADLRRRLAAKDQQGQELVQQLDLNQITAKKHSEEKLRDILELQRLAMEAAQLGAWEYNPQTRILFWDERTREIFGVSSDEIIDRRRFETLVYPEDLPYCIQNIAKVLDPSDEKSSVEDQYRIVRANGDVRWISVTGKKFIKTDCSGNKLVRVIGTHKDITASKLAEEELRDGITRNDGE